MDKASSKKIKVLIFPAGEINAIELHDALATCVNVELWGASSVNRHGEYVFKNYISKIPKIFEKNFFDVFNELIIQKEIDVIFPTHDTVAQLFAENREKINAKIICSDADTADICRDKAKIYELFKDMDFCPKVYQDASTLPVFIKPREGQGAVGARLINVIEELPSDYCSEKFVTCEYLPGQEYTIDCFTDRHGTVRAILPRTRERLLAGVTVSSRNIEADDEIQSIVETINRRLKFRGLWWIQLKEDANKKKKLLEISVRCAGTMCMARAKGVNLALLSIYDAFDKEIDVTPNDYDVKMDRTLISRYKLGFSYKVVYFDFDDTLVIEGKVHLPSIAFLYQCRNKGKKIVLLTRHEDDIRKDLKRYFISEKIFDEIIWITDDKEKSEFIREKEAILIDNAYACRKEVAEKCHIPVFDVDMIEVLVDWRW